MTTFPALYKQAAEEQPQTPRKTFRLRLHDAEKKDKDEEFVKQIRSTANMHEEHSVYFDLDEHDGHFMRCGTMPCRPWTTRDPTLIRSTKSSPDLHHNHQNDLIWVDPIKAWIPVRQKSKCYESFWNAPILRNKAKYEFLDPCPHIHPCIHSKSAIMIQAEKDRLQAVGDFRQQQRLQRHLERMRKYEGDWEKFSKLAADHIRTSDNRLTAFRKTKEHYVNPMDGIRKQRENERQKEVERKQQIEEEQRLQRLKTLEEERLRVPEILITSYEEELMSLYSQDDIQSACSEIYSEHCVNLVHQTADSVHSLPLSEHGSIRGRVEQCGQDRRVCQLAHHQNDEVFSLDEKIHHYLEVLEAELKVDSNTQVCQQTDTAGLLAEPTEEQILESRPVISMADGIPDDLMGASVPVPLGVSDGRVSDTAMLASSSYNQLHGPAQGRLNNIQEGNKAGAWRPKLNNEKQYLQVDFTKAVSIKQVATQGQTLYAGQQARKSYVKTYTLKHSLDGRNWEDYKEKGRVKVFVGNTDAESVVLNSLAEPVNARFVRLHPKSWKTNVCLRVEVYGNELEEAMNEADGEEMNEQDEASITVEAIEIIEMEEELVHVETEQEEGVAELFVEETKKRRIVKYGSKDEKHTIKYIPPKKEEPVQEKPNQQITPKQSPRKEEKSPSKKKPTKKKEKKKKVVVIREEPEAVFEYPPESVASNSPPPSPQPEPSPPPIPVIPQLPVIPPIPAFQEVERPESKRSPRKTMMFSPLPVEEEGKKPLPKAVSDNRIRDELRRQKLAEERRKKLMALAERKKKINSNNDDDVENQDNNSTLDEFMTKYCILDESRVRYFERLFELYDEDHDGFLFPDEVLEALEHVNKDLLSDSHLNYVYRILDLCDCSVEDGADFKLFSVVAAFSQKVAQLDDYMKLLISKMDFKELDFYLQNAKSLFMCYADQETRKLSLETLVLELMAGRINVQYSVDLTLKLGGKEFLDFLDFLTYIPLFLHIHKNVLENPL